jgi:WD40 repeat protein
LEVRPHLHYGVFIGGTLRIWQNGVFIGSTFRVWQIRNEQVLHMLERHNQKFDKMNIEDMIATPDGYRAVSLTDENIIHICSGNWNDELEQIVSTSVSHPGCYRVIMALTGRQVISISDDAIKIWNFDTGQITSTLDDTTKIWNIGTGQITSTLDERSKGINNVVFIPNQYYIIFSKIGVWELNTGRSIPDRSRLVALHPAVLQTFL